MIRPGDSYGRPGLPPPDAVEVWTDEEASSCIARARGAGVAPPALILRGGDLRRTLGGGASGPTPAPGLLGLEVPIDLGVLTAEGEHWFFVAHAILRAPLWTGRFMVAMNAQWCSDLDLGPRSHPGDGLLDITEGQLGLRQRVSARSRARSGTHLPHPALRTARCPEWSVEFDHSITVHVDGRPRLRTARATVSVDHAVITAYL